MINFSYMLEDNRQKVNEVLTRYIYAFTHQKNILIHAMCHGVLLGGKRIRPFLVYQTGKLFGLTSISLDAPAAAIECIHAYSLIHDDLPMMDNDLIRRGMPTCHVQFGDTTALLAGNALQSLAFNILADADMPKISLPHRLKMISTLASSSGANGICFGQSLDLTMEADQFSIVKLEKIHRYKTGELIRTAVRMGAIAAGELSNSILCYLDHFATAIGLAFQIKDDMIDIFKDDKIYLKNKKNEKFKKRTYPSLLGLDIARKKYYDLYDESMAYLERISELGYDITTLAALARYIIERDK